MVESSAIPCKVDNDTSSKTIEEGEDEGKRVQIEKKQIQVKMNLSRKKKWICLKLQKILAQVDYKPNADL